MKTLYLVRHAKSSWEDPYQKDFDRPLNDRGIRNAPRMGKRLKEKEIHPDLMLSSPAVRALSTCQAIAAILGYEANLIQTDRKLYHASEVEILAIVNKLNDKLEDVMIFGHNPGLTDFINNLNRSSDIIDNLPTCGVVAFKLSVGSWRDVQWKAGDMEFFDFPKNGAAKS
jgi:phosphohistidine phosphatase